MRLATEWLGKTLPNWYQPCPIKVQVGQIGAGGETTFNFMPNPKSGRMEVGGWRMRVQGTAERILDSVIPHEVSHTIFASHFRRPLPRWADEGAATLVEHDSEKHFQVLTLREVWGTSRRIPLRSLLAMKEYPTDVRDVRTLYAEGYSLADFLVQMGGKSRYLAFLEDSARGDWEAAIRKHYKYEGIESLEGKWSGWILAGSPALHSDGTIIADAGTPAASPAPTAPSAPAAPRSNADVTIRAQNADAPPALQTASIETAAFSPADFAPPVRVAAVPAAAVAVGKRSRPAPLESFIRHDQSQSVERPSDIADAPRTRSRVATETAWQPVGPDGSQSLPATVRAEPAAPAREFDFFTPSATATAPPARTLGLGDFPGRGL